MKNIMNISISKIIMFFLLINVTLFSCLEVNAATVLESKNPSLIESATENKNITINDDDNTIKGGGTLEKAEDYVDSKLNDVVGFLQSFVKPFAYASFIISAIAILIGVVTNSKHKFAGLLGMAFSILIYVAITFAPQIVEYFAAWLAI